MTTISQAGGYINISQSGTTISYSKNGGSLTAITSFPVTFINSTVSPTISTLLTVNFTSNLTLSGSTSNYFIIGSSYIIIDGSNSTYVANTVTISGTSNYPGLIKNSSYSNILIKYIGVLVSDSTTTLSQSAGWICQSSFGGNSANNIINYCYSSWYYNTSSQATFKYLGGIIGGNSNYITANYCYSLGSNSTNFIQSGGIFGYPCKYCNANYCYSIQTVNGGWFGGIFGGGSYNRANYCYFDGIGVRGNFGGIFGFYSNNSTAKYCYCICPSITYGSGGIFASGAGNTAKNCYSTATLINGSGGIFGSSTSTSTATNCYSTGTISSSGNVSGGIFGYNANGTANNCYCNSPIASNTTISQSNCYVITSGSSWNDTTANSKLITNTNIWTDINLNNTTTKYKLTAFNTLIYNPSTVTGITSSYTATPETYSNVSNYTLISVNNTNPSSYTNNVALNTSTGVLTFTNVNSSTYNANVMLLFSNGSYYISSFTVNYSVILTPNNGPIEGGTSVSLTGSKFTGTTSVILGSNYATNLVVSSDSNITLTTPSSDITSVANSVNVSIYSTSGIYTLYDGFTYNSTTSIITQQPQSTTVTVGDLASFTVTVYEVASTTYQWYFGINQILGATLSTYTIPSAQTSNAGSYYVNVVNDSLSVNSSTATLTVYDEPTITIQPTSITVNEGELAFFSVTATGTLLTYQWYFDGYPISGATSYTYDIPSAQPSDDGSYYVIVTNSGGSVTSSTATLTLYTAPTITITPSSITITQGSSASFSATATGIPTPTYQWYFNGYGISGATSDTYYISSAQTSDDGSYYVIAENSAGSATSNTVTLTVNTIPTITSQPSSTTVNQGSSASFSANATGTPTPTYKWYFNGSEISGATSSTYYISSAQTSNDGSYYVIATNTAGSATSNTVTLTVYTAPTITSQPSSTTVIAGSSASFSASASGTPSPTYQWYYYGFTISGATSSTYYISSAQTSNDGSYYVIATNTAGSATSNTAILTVYTAPTINVNPQPITVIDGSPTSFSVNASGTPSPTYQWYFNGSEISGATSSTYNISFAQKINEGDYYVILKNSVGSVTSKTARLSINSNNTYIIKNINKLVSDLHKKGIYNSSYISKIVIQTLINYGFKNVSAYGIYSKIDGLIKINNTSFNIVWFNTKKSDASNYYITETNSVSSTTDKVVPLNFNSSNSNNTDIIKNINKLISDLHKKGIYNSSYISKIVIQTLINYGFKNVSAYGIYSKIDGLIKINNTSFNTVWFNIKKNN